MAAFICWLAVRMLECHRLLKPTGSLYLHIDHTAHAYAKVMMDAIFGRGNFRNEIVWHYSNLSAAKRYFPRKHDTILFYTKGKNWQFNANAVRIPYSDSSRNRVRYKGSGFASKAEGSWLKEGGKLPDSVWDIPLLKGNERTGYPTQKPLALYERIIQASSNPGDFVLDPHCGCATTPVAAERLGRRWIGMDIWTGAHQMVLDRLKKEQQIWLPDQIKLITTPPERTDDGEVSTNHLSEVFGKAKKPKWNRNQMANIIAERWGTRCWTCGYEPPALDYLDLDHILPKSDGGSNDLDNRALLCGPCNRDKSNNLTLSALRKQNKRKNKRWFGKPPIDEWLKLDQALEWARMEILKRDKVILV